MRHQDILRSPYREPAPQWFANMFAPTLQKEHCRLKAELEDWANYHGYIWNINTLPGGKQPDVLRRALYHPSLFLGDAKDATNETPNRSDTFERVNGYVQEFGIHLRNRTYSGGQIAIATNSFPAARNWRMAMQRMTNWAYIVSLPSNGPVDFHITDVCNGQTWIIHS